MTRKQRRKKHWRKYLANNLLPAKFQLVEYKPLIEKIVQIARGEETYPRDIYSRFFRALNHKLYGSGELKTATPLLLKNYSTRLIALQQEDLQQQCWLFLLELWDFFTFTWSQKGSSKSTVFYDYARAQLTRWIGSYVGNQILLAEAERTGGHTPLLESYEMEDPQIFKLDLGWVALKSKDGVFSKLTVKQKYLLYLRYSKELTIDEISSLVKQHRAKIEEEFSIIKRVFHGGASVATRT